MGTVLASTGRTVAGGGDALACDPSPAINLGEYWT